MTVSKRRIALAFLDAVSVNFSVLLAFIIRFDGAIPQVYSSRLLSVCLISTVIALPIFYLFQLYKSLWRFASIRELIMIVSATVAVTGASFISFTLLQMRLPLSVHVNFFFLITAFLGVSRLGFRVLRRLESNFASNGMKKYKRVMIVGAGAAGAMIIREVQSHPEMLFKPVALIDDDPSKRRSKLMGVPVLGTRETIPSVAKEEEIDEIIVAIPSGTKTDIQNILKECKKTKCKLKTLPGLYELIDGKVTIQKIRDVDIEDLLGREAVELDLEEISGYLRNETVLVTGGGGSIGSELCRQIARFQPKKLIILDIYENNAYDLQKELERTLPDLDHSVIIGSIRDKARIDEVFDTYRPGVVFHAAAHKHVCLMEDNPSEAVKNNVLGTQNVAECADKYGTKRFVLISTDKAVNPTNIMGATKRISEMIIQALDRTSNTEFVAVRFGNVLGSNGSVIPLFKKQIAAGGPVTVTHPEINRFFMTVTEAVQLVIQAGAMAEGGEIFVLDMGEPVKIIDLARDLILLSGLEPEVDIEIKFTGLRPGEKLYEELLMKEEDLTSTKHEKIFIGRPTSYDISRLKREIERIESNGSLSADEVVSFVSRLVPTYRRAEERIVG